MKSFLLALSACCALVTPCVAQDTNRTALLLDGLGVYVANSYIGVSALAGPLKQQGYRPVVDTHMMNRTGSEIPVVIIGHSMGGSAGLAYARKLVQAGYPAPLVITIDAAPNPPPCPVARCINIHGPGFPDVAGAQNIDAWKSGANMVNHAMLATHPAIQQMVLRYTATLMAQNTQAARATETRAAASPPAAEASVPLPPPAPRRSGEGG
ncbi:alpha/beta fold hydrolase [Bosea sp. 117]|uniref:alpha/beta fold hydrolase n=1 Tax=Bosea sp. 117 TaxID=1125973 RepID=UPI00068AF8D6|nr:alpha/beta fold hydrolase [Bosea sp. 117]